MKLRRASEMTKNVLSEVNLHQLDSEHAIEHEESRKEGLTRGRSHTNISHRKDRAKALIEVMKNNGTLS